jgi:hypothetical protein
MRSLRFKDFSLRETVDQNDYLVGYDYDTLQEIRVPIGSLNQGESADFNKDIIINIDPEGESTRLFGLVFDMLGGTYTVSLTNCQIYSEEDQSQDTQTDHLGQITVPSMVVPLQVLSELVGGVQVNELGYDLESLLEIMPNITLYKTDWNESSPIKIQSGSVITFCIKPINPEMMCTIKFTRQQDTGRIINLKRFTPSTTDYEIGAANDII